MRPHVRSLMRARGLLQFCEDDTELRNHLDALYAHVGPQWQQQLQRVATLELQAVAASTTDHASQGVENTTVDDSDFWSSTGSANADAGEALLYRLGWPLARVTHVTLAVCRAEYLHGDPLYPPQEVSFLAGPTPLQLLPASPRYPVRLTDQRQTFALAAGAPPAAWLMVRLHGRTQRVLQDGLLYLAVRHVAAHGLPLQPHLVAAIPRALRAHCGLACWPLTSAFAQQHPPQEQPNHPPHHQQQAESGDGTTPAADAASSSAGGGQGSAAGAAAGGGTARAAAALRRLWGRISGGGGGATGGGVLAAPPAPWALRLQQQWQAEAGQRGEGAVAAPPCGPSCAELQACVAAQALARALVAAPRACSAAAPRPKASPAAGGACPAGADADEAVGAVVPCAAHRRLPAVAPKGHAAAAQSSGTWMGGGPAAAAYGSLAHDVVCGNAQQQQQGQQQARAEAAALLLGAARQPACYRAHGQLLVAVELGEGAARRRGPARRSGAGRALGHVQGVGAAGPWLVSHYDHEHW